jgi:flagellar hook-associated protein 3 FlgL
MVSRVTNLSSSRLINSLILKSQNRINEQQIRLTTQQKSQDYLGIGDDTSRLLTVESSLRRIDQFVKNNAFIDMRMETMLNSMDAVGDILKEVRTLVRDVLEDGTLEGIDKNDFTEIKMDQLEGFLNVKMNGRFLFSGTKTDTQPVNAGDLADAPTFDADGVTTTAEPSFFYQGDDNQVKARIDEGVTLEYGVKANNEGFEKLIRAIRLVKSTDLTDARVLDKFQHALNLLNESADKIGAVELNTGVKFQQLASTTRSLKDTKSILDGVVDEIERADTFEAVSILNQVQTQLEASYATAVRVSSLSLTRFLTR